MSGWFYLESGRGAPAWNMAVDEALLEFARELGRPVLRFYGWTEAAATFGYFQAYEQISKWTSLRPLIRRPTGGGLVPHDRDWTYTLVFPPSHEWHSTRAEESYRRAHDWISRAFEQISVTTELARAAVHEQPGQCFIGAEKFDLLHRGRKIAGAAQRRNKHGLLIQGSVQEQPAGVERKNWEAAMLEAGSDREKIAWEELQLPKEMIERAESLAFEKYGSEQYNQKK